MWLNMPCFLSLPCPIWITIILLSDRYLVQHITCFRVGWVNLSQKDIRRPDLDEWTRPRYPGLGAVKGGDRLLGELCTHSQVYVEYCLMWRKTLLVETVWEGVHGRVYVHTSAHNGVLGSRSVVCQQIFFFPNNFVISLSHGHSLLFLTI